MTTYQDPPLQSRRAVRQGERPESQQFSPFAPQQGPRTAAGVGEPLSYVTQNRPPLPGYGRPSDEPTSSPANHGRRAAAPADAESDGESPQSFRPRDYSPEARTAPPAWSPELDRESGVVEYHTQARANVTPPASLAASLAGEPSEQTLTRRELRALRESQGITDLPVSTASERQSPPPAPAVSTQLDSAMAEFDALAGRSAEEASARRAGRRAATQPSSEQPEGNEQPHPEQPHPEQHAVVLPPEPAPMPPSQFAPPAGEPIAASPLAPMASPVAPTTGERPIGHWTNQSDIDDRIQVSQSSISRTVGSSAITTSALVLPSIPGHDMDSGEIILTDSVSLPANLAATGAHHSIDEADLDHLLDPGDHQAINTDSVPIRAVRAVSSHTNSRNQFVATAKPNRGGRAITALIVAASGMAVVVVTLLVVALVNGGL